MRWLNKGKYYIESNEDANTTISWQDDKTNFLLWIKEPIGAFGTLQAAKNYHKKHYYIGKKL